MIIIHHRRNTINELQKTDFRFGIEVDIRSNNGELIIEHDPFKIGAKFKDWLKFYNHKVLILNVKEEGLEQNLFDIMKINSIENYFLLDQTFPSLIKTSFNGNRNSAVRLSEFESIETVVNLSSKINWVWIDMFSRFPIDKKKYLLLKNIGYKLCIVSPELHNNPDIEIFNLYKLLKKEKINCDAVCTKKPFLWEKLINN